MPYKVLLKYFIVTCLVVIVGVQSLILALPLIAESQIKSRLPEFSALGLDFCIADMGLTRTIFRDIRLGRDLTADLVELRYQWRGPKAFQVEKIIVSGLLLDLELTGSQGIRFNRMEFPLADKGEGPGEKKQDWQDLKAFFPFIPKQIRIKNSHLTLKHPQGKFKLPSDLMIRLDPGRGTGDIRLAANPLGQTVNLKAGLDLKAALEDGPDKSVRQIELTARNFNPGCLALLFPELFGKVDFKGPLDIFVKGSGPRSLRFNFTGASLKVPGWPGMRLADCIGDFTGTAVNGKGKLTLSGSGFSDTDLDLDFTAGFKPGQKPDFTLALNDREMPEMVFDLAGQIPGGRLVIKKPGLFLEAKGTVNQQTCRVKFTGHSLEMSSGAGNLALNQVLFDLDLARKGEGDFPVGSGEFEFKAKEISSQFKGNRMDCPRVKITAGIAPDREKLFLDFDGIIEDLRVKNGGSAFATDRAGVSGRLTMDHARSFSGKMLARVKNGSLEIRDKGISVTGIDLGLPLTYPFRPDTGSGRLKVDSLGYDNRFFAGLIAGLTQTGDTRIALKGKISTRMMPDLILDLALEAGADPDAFTPWADIRLNSHIFVLTGEDVSRVVPGIDIPGDFNLPLSLDTRVSLQDNILDTGGAVRVHGGSIDFPDLDLKARGISGQVEFDDLILPDSLPGQVLTVETVNAGQFRFDDGIFRFSIENGRSLNLENLKFKWCNGLVSTESFRLPDPDGRIFLTLYCDRLEMDSLLRQIGAFDAQGGGTLSGRIPVVYNKGEISFDNGFLFSTPGQTGRVFVKDLDRMLEGFPKDTPEFSQLDLAGEALKDFQYEWAKLRMNTHGDTLDVRMELDGKPAGVLPFEYRKDMNSFMRVDASSPGSRFQGVKLDVNLKLPFNRVMKFGNKLKNMME